MTQLYQLAASVLVAVLLFAGGFVKGCTHAKDEAEKERTAYELAQQKALRDAQQAIIDRERENAALAKRIGDELEPALQAATDRAVALSRSLREYQDRSRRCALSLAARASSGADEAPGEPASDDGVGEATEALITACARDAERLGKLQEWVRSVR